MTLVIGCDWRIQTQDEDSIVSPKKLAFAHICFAIKHMVKMMVSKTISFLRHKPQWLIITPQ